MIIGNDIMYEIWEPGTPMHRDLINNVVAKFNTSVAGRALGHLEEDQRTYEHDQALVTV